MTRREMLRLLACTAPMTMVVMQLISATAQDAPKDAQKQQELDRALIKAIRSHNVQAVRDLLSKGADANARDLDATPNRRGTVQPPFTREKPTALLIVFDDAEIPTGKKKKGVPQYKRRPDPSEIVQALLDKGADPNVSDYDEFFPLLQAVQYKYVASVRLLLKYHANPNQSWVHGITPLHRAVSNKDIPTVKALLADGANPEARCAFDNPAHPLSEEVARLLKEFPDKPQR